MYFNLLRYYTVHQHFQPWFLYHSTHPILFSESIWIKITKQFETTLEENDHHDESDGNRKNHGWIWQKKSPIRIMYESNTSRKITEKSGIIGNWKYIIKHERIWHGRKKQGQIWHVKKDFGRICFYHVISFLRRFFLAVADFSVSFFLLSHSFLTFREISLKPSTRNYFTSPFYDFYPYLSRYNFLKISLETLSSDICSKWRSMP